MAVAEQTKAEQLEQELRQFIGTENYYKLAFGKITDGAKYLADAAGAYWLVDDICIHNAFTRTLKANRDFQVWTLTKNKTGRGAKLVAEDGNKTKLFSTRIPFTDFPLDSIQLYFINGVVLLPSEY